MHPYSNNKAGDYRDTLCKRAQAGQDGRHEPCGVVALPCVFDHIGQFHGVPPESGILEPSRGVKVEVQRRAVLVIDLELVLGQGARTLNAHQAPVCSEGGSIPPPELVSPYARPTSLSLPPHLGRARLLSLPLPLEPRDLLAPPSMLGA